MKSKLICPHCKKYDALSYEDEYNNSIADNPYCFNCSRNIYDENDYYIKTRIVYESFYKVKAPTADVAMHKTGAMTMNELEEDVPQKSWTQKLIDPHDKSSKHRVNKFTEIKVDVEDEYYEIITEAK
jgi:hypothetical protein